MILVDENVRYSLVRELRKLGVDVLSVVDSGFRGIFDNDLVELVDREGRVLLTRDKDLLEEF